MDEELPSFLLVDGNNIIHAWQDLLDLHRRSPGSAHRQLVKRLTCYQDFSGDRVVVVFDGRAGKTIEEREPGGIQVFYTGSDKTADDVIERLAVKYAATYRVTVATDDRAEQDGVVAAGGDAISSLSLHDRLVGSERRMSDWLERRRKR